MKTATFGLFVSLLHPRFVMGHLDLLRVRQHPNKQVPTTRSAVNEMDNHHEAELAFRELLAWITVYPSSYRALDSTSLSYAGHHHSSDDYPYNAGDDGYPHSTYAPIAPAIPSTVAPYHTPPTMPPAMVPTETTEAPVTTSSTTLAPATSPAPTWNDPVIITDDLIMTDDSSLGSSPGTLLEAPIPVQDTPRSSSSGTGTGSTVDTVIAASVNQPTAQGSSGPNPSQTAMVVVLAVAAAAIGAAFIAHKIYSGGIVGGSRGSVVSENSWIPAGGPVDGATPHAGVQKSAGIDA